MQKLGMPSLLAKPTNPSLNAKLSPVQQHLHALFASFPMHLFSKNALNDPKALSPRENP
jgi:hypothetical protein